MNAEHSVAHLLWTGATGGIERLVRDLAVEQRSRGIHVSVVFAGEGGPFASALREAGVRCSVLGLRSGFDIRPSRVQAGVAALREAGLVHLHAFNLPLATAAVASRRPIVFTEHGNFGLGRAASLADHLRWSLQRQFLCRPRTAIAANSAWTADRMAALRKLERTRIAVVHNGVDVSRAPSFKPAATETGLTIASVGRLAGVKRVDRLIRAVAMIGPETPIHLSIVGGGPLLSELQALTDSLGQSGRIAFQGERRDVDTILASSDLLVQASQGEAFGLAVLEATLAGAMPIAFSDGGGALEVLPPDAKIVDDEMELAALLSDLAGSQNWRGEDARRARSRWASANLSIAGTADRYSELYRALTR